MRGRHEKRGSEPEGGGKEEKKRGRIDGALKELEREGGARGGWVRRRRRRHGERRKREKLALGRGNRDLLVAPIEGARARALVGWLRRSREEMDLGWLVLNEGGFWIKENPDVDGGGARVGSLEIRWSGG